MMQAQTPKSESKPKISQMINKHNTTRQNGRKANKKAPKSLSTNTPEHIDVFGPFERKISEMTKILENHGFDLENLLAVSEATCLTQNRLKWSF
jgi:deoxyribodipyrimidine photolyase